MIDLSPDGLQPLPRPVVDILRPHLSYKFKQMLHGPAAYDAATGAYDPVLIEDREMFNIVEGRLTAGYGFIPKIVRVLTHHGYHVHYLDVSPRRARPNCYVADWRNVMSITKFRPRQLECLQAIYYNEGGVINAVPGFGKTHSFRQIALLYPYAKIHIVVKFKDVAEKTVARLSEVLPNVGQVGGGQGRWGRVTVVMADSLHRSDGDCDILLGDEAHTLMSPDYARELARAYRNSRNFMFSATPDCRMDGAHARLEMFAGPQIFYLSYPEAVALGLVAPIRVRWLPIRLRDNPAAGKASGVPRMRWGIWRNEERNAIFAADARLNYGPDHQVLMLVSTLEHALYLHKHLPEYQLCYGSIANEKAEKFARGGLINENFVPITPEIRNMMRLDFERGVLKKVIATDVWSTGVDFEPLQVCYRLDARESEILGTQLPGRTSRIFDGKAYGELIDGYDWFDPSLQRKSDMRKKYYAKNGWAQDMPVRSRV